MFFSRPFALILLLLIPFFIWVSWQRISTRSNQRMRLRLSLLLRLLIVILIVLSIAGAQSVRAGDQLAVVFLVDASDSMSQAQGEMAESLIRDTLGRMGPDEQAAVVLFGAEPLVERSLSSITELASFRTVPASLHTDIAAAIHLGLGLLPADSGRRMVIISDGLGTRGDLDTAARLAAAANVSLDVVYLPHPEADVEVSLLEVDAPPRIGADDLLRLDVVLESSDAMDASLRVFAGESLLLEQVVTLREGANNYSFQVPAASQDFTRYQVQVAPAADTYYQNNQLFAYTEVAGAPRVLLVAPQDAAFSGEAIPLQGALAATGIDIRRVTTQDFPGSLSELGQYASILLVDVNASDLAPRDMAAVQQYVRDLGGGLVVVGGPNSYGMGGYFQTPLERTLPVDMQIDDQERFPAVSLAMVLDRSGSMEQQEGGFTKMQLAGEGAVRAVQLLHEFDEVTIIPVDTDAGAQIGPLPAAAAEEIIAAVRAIEVGGGGIYVRSGLETAAAALEGSVNPVKHIVLLADGADAEEQEGVPELIAALADQGITVSVVSIGEGPDSGWLEEMAGLGNGRFHLTDQAANLPQIFAQETVSIQRNYLIEEEFFPQLANESPILSGITALPSLNGYVGTSPKEAAQVILTTHQGDPLLAAWQYGLGRAAAWTSDATGRWAGDWLGWAGFPRFWAQVVDWTISGQSENLVEMSVDYTEGLAILTADMRDESAGYLNDLDVKASVVGPDGATIPLDLPQNAPGSYAASFEPGAEGVYLIRVAGQTPEGEIAAANTMGWALGYSPEYRDLKADPRALLFLAEQTGGRDLSDLPVAELAAAVFAHDLPVPSTRQPIWTWLALIALLLLPLDIALRRLVIGREDLVHAWSSVTSRLSKPSTPEDAAEEPVSRLFEAKKRAQVKDESLTPPSVTEPASDTSEVQPAAAPETAEPDQPASDQDDYLAARLLQKKQTRDDDAK